MAERQGFEPWVPFGTSVFKTGAFDHSATSPRFFGKKHFIYEKLSCVFSLDPKSCRIIPLFFVDTRTR